MKLLCNLGLHSWADCKCSQCGRVRDEQHRWDGCVCPVCRSIRDVDHVWRDEDCEICGGAVPPEVWAQNLKDKKDYRALAAINNSNNYSDSFNKWRKAALANSILREAGAEAVEAILEELATDGVGSVDLANVLVEVGDPKAVPLLKQKLARGDFAAYGSQYSIRDFVARFDAGLRSKIEASAQEKEEKLTEARAAVSSYDAAAMLAALRRLCDAYATMSPDAEEIERLELIATAIGERLNSEGGIAEMRGMFDRLGGVRGARTLDMHWGGIGDWRG
jgi:hypothetical protein